jgi:L-ascorbate metabolism protein UlaG (beta-lactamase superfamily)
LRKLFILWKKLDTNCLSEFCCKQINMDSKPLNLNTLPVTQSMIKNETGSFSTTEKQRDFFQLIRHATLIVQMAGTRILVDPMLSAKGTMDPVANCGNNIRIPMVDLPFEPSELRTLVATVDAVLLTHLHRDHWDGEARSIISKDTRVFCQPGDEQQIREAGFSKVTPVEGELFFNGLKINITGGRHGSGEIGEKMGKVSGFILQSGYNSLYIAGDTIYCDEVKAALETYKPREVILNAGAAEFFSGGPITMDLEDLKSVISAMPKTSGLTAVHMDAVNHCMLTRKILREAIEAVGLLANVRIPEDGQKIFL